MEKDDVRRPRSRKRAPDCSGRIVISDQFGDFEVDTILRLEAIAGCVQYTCQQFDLSRPLVLVPFMPQPPPPPPPPPPSLVLTLLESVREAEPRMTEEEMLLLALAVRSRRGSLASVTAAELVRLIHEESRKRSARNILRAYAKFAKVKIPGDAKSLLGTLFPDNAFSHLFSDAHYTRFSSRVKVVLSASDGDECAICLESLAKLPVESLDCGHAFHVKCITLWYNEKYECPCCRRHVKLWLDFPSLP
jgi:hypothetical protein